MICLPPYKRYYRILLAAILLCAGQAEVLAQQDDAREQPEISGIERSVMPVTRWLERQLQEAPLLQPSTRKKTDPAPTNSLSLREAIQMAQQQFPGTVLSADRIREKDTLRFRIKMLSSEGVVQLVEIDGQRQPQKEVKNETPAD